MHTYRYSNIACAHTYNSSGKEFELLSLSIVDDFLKDNVLGLRQVKKPLSED